MMKLEYDLKKLYLDSLAPQPGEKIYFINDFPQDPKKVTAEHRHRADMTVLWHKEMCELSELIGCTTLPIITLDLRDPNPATLDADAYQNGSRLDFKALMAQWGPQDVIIAITGPSITGVLIPGLETQKYRFASAPNVTVDFEGFKADYSKIPLRFALLTNKMGQADAAEMTFRYEGSVFKCTLDLRGQRFMFKENGAAHRPGEFINYPSGCANISPYPGIAGDVRGESRTEGQIPAIINDELVVFTLAQNRIVAIDGEGEEADKERQHVLDPGHPELAVVTKLGLGVNDESRCNGTHVGDEKTMGMHWGYGPKKHFPDTIWAEHPIQMDMDFVYPGGRREPIFRSNFYTENLGNLF